MNSKTSDQTLESGTRAGGTDGSLGEKLRRAREARGMTLREISEQTRITVRHLEAIETSDYKHLPGGIFNRSFIKAYAKQIHFDERQALDLYMREARERGESEETATSSRRSQVYTSDTSRSPLMNAVMTAVILGILVLIVYAGLHWYRRASDETASADTPAPASAANPTTPPAQTAPAPQTQQQQAALPADGSFKIQVQAKDKSFWLTTREDEAKSKGRMLNPAKPEDFAPQDKLYLLFGKNNADALAVTVNGRVIRPPADSAGAEIEWTITKDNYQQFLP